MREETRDKICIATSYMACFIGVIGFILEWYSFFDRTQIWLFYSLSMSCLIIFSYKTLGAFDDL